MRNVKQTLLDITKGVSDANEESLVWIAPGYVDREKVFAAQLVSFGVAATASKEGGGGINVLVTSRGRAVQNTPIAFRFRSLFISKRRKNLRGVMLDLIDWSGASADNDCL